MIDDEALAKKTQNLNHDVRTCIHLTFVIYEKEPRTCERRMQPKSLILSKNYELIGDI